MDESSYIICEFPTGSAVTIDIYKLSDNSKVVSAASMAEIGTTGIFKYLQNLNPSVLTEYLFIATDGLDTRKGKIAEEYLMIADLMEKHFEKSLIINIFIYGFIII